MPQMMKAVALTPRVPDSIHLRDVPVPVLAESPDGGRRSVLVQVLRVGVDGTDAEIYHAEYGAAPPGDDHLIVGHESLGRIVEVGADVTEFAAGDHVVAMVRRPGSSLYDVIGEQDMTTDETYFERGINLRHGFLTEYYVEYPEFLIQVPRSLSDVAVLLEPLSVVEKGIAEAFEIQRRLRVWRPRRAAIIGPGSIGLLAALVLRLRGLDVTAYALHPKPNLNAQLAEAIGARYVPAAEGSVLDGAMREGPFDLIIEASGFSPAAFQGMQALNKNGVLVLASITGGTRVIEVPSDRINLSFVLGNKVAVGTVNAGREHFEMGVRDLALAEAQFPGWLESLITDRVVGLESYQVLYERLTKKRGVIKAVCEISGQEIGRGARRGD